MFTVKYYFLNIAIKEVFGNFHTISPNDCYFIERGTIFPIYSISLK